MHEQTDSISISAKREIIRDWQKIKPYIPKPLHSLIRRCIIKNIEVLECYTKGEAHFINTKEELRFETGVVLIKTNDPQFKRLIGLAGEFPREFEVIKHVSYGSNLNGVLLSWSSKIPIEKIPEIIKWLES